MTLVPDGDLVHSRVVTDPGDPLAAALDRGTTGYAVLEPQDTLLLDADDRGVFALRDGVPVRAYHTGTGRGGADAVADLARTGPYRAELYAHPDAASDGRGDRLAPSTAADLLADDPALAERTRRAAPDDAADAGSASLDAVEAFLEDEEKIEAIRERAREEAARRAEEWGFDDL